MAILCELFHDICWHSKIHMVFLVVPFQSKFAVVLGNKSGIVLSVLGGKGTPGMFDPVL